MIYNPRRGPLVKGIMVLGIIGSLAGLSQEYRRVPSEVQVDDMGFQYSYEGTTNTEIEKLLLLYDCVDTADANVLTSNGAVYSVTVTLTGSGWRNVCEPLAEEIRKLYPKTRVSFYDTNLNIVYSE